MIQIIRCVSQARRKAAEEQDRLPDHDILPVSFVGSRIIVLIFDDGGDCRRDHVLMAIPTKRIFPIVLQACRLTPSWHLLPS